MLDYIIIGMVYNEALTGYDIKKYIEDGIGIFYKASYGSLYPSLKRLTEKGCLTMFEQPQGGRQKKFYRMTDQGKNAFLNWLASPMEKETENHLAKVFFFDRLPEHIRNQQLQEYEMANMKYLRYLQKLEKHFAAMENKECFYYKLSTLYYGIRTVQNNILWCRHIREQKPLSELNAMEVEA